MRTIEINPETHAVIEKAQLAAIEAKIKTQAEEMSKLKLNASADRALINNAIVVYEKVTTLLPGLKTGNPLAGANIMGIATSLGKDKKFTETLNVLGGQIDEYKKHTSVYTIIQK